ncbi:phosphate transport system substrate-binding protein [Franzmannia pantelleriensis]|uniref:Phosphate-binding protein n=1 Tax=Franzmannia pantelleriensis TaxID=48727 RepID=A0A1G9K5N7_9GAMM|nr:phosphate ABC transporter substrate-binding protein PstS family protein [Halomonas pantelleriensis]SDL44675.1 phosphate transport system substrate-binding protein [Halomonas pantelleriensis]
MKLKVLAAAVIGASFISTHAMADVDPDLPEYETVSGISGNMTSIGSDTLNNLMTLWAEEFAGYYPNVNIQIQGAGSGTAPTALTEGTAQFGPMSREMRTSEIQEFEERFGYPPTMVPVAIDALAVYVNQDNPIESLTIPQIDAIFSDTRRCGYDEDITRWGQLGLDGNWENRDFTLYSRNAVSGTYGFFAENALCGGDFKASINEQPGSASVVQGVSESVNGIGYSGIGYITSQVRAVPVARDEGEEAYEVSHENYPLARYLMVYVNKHPNEDLDPQQAEFLRMILSRQGQEVTNRDGYIPLPEAVASRVRAELDLD